MFTSKVKKSKSLNTRYERMWRCFHQFASSSSHLRSKSTPVPYFPYGALFHCLSSALLPHPHCLGVPYFPGVNVAMSILGKKWFTCEHENAVTGSATGGIVDGSSYCLLLNDEVRSNTAKPWSSYDSTYDPKSQRLLSQESRY